MPVSGRPARLKTSVSPDNSVGSPVRQAAPVPVSGREFSHSEKSGRFRSALATGTSSEQARAELLAILSKPFESDCASCDGTGAMNGRVCSECRGKGMVSIRLV